MTDDVLDLIDAAVQDWDVSLDAMRCRGISSPAPMRPGAVSASNLVPRGPVVVFSTGQTFPVLNMELVLRPVVDHFATMAEGFRLLSQRMGEITISTVGFTAQLARAFGIELPHGAPGALPCACHSRPFPAAWDYQRRTRHRNRRRR